MGEKFAIITDIHGNSAALRAVLDDIKKNKDISHTYCLGDMIAIGHESNEVLEMLFSEVNISFVMGNHDQSVLDIISGKKPRNNDIVLEHHQWIAEHLDKKYLERLSQVPLKLNKEISGKSVLFLHYHLNESERFLSLNTDPSVTNLDEIYENAKEDIVCFGHHHTIHHFKSRNRLYLNPGSLGCGQKPFAPYGIVEIGDEGGVNVQFKEVPYDNREFLISIHNLKFPAYKVILKNFHGNQHNIDSIKQVIDYE